MVLKADAVDVEVKKPAGKWEKVSGESYAKVAADPGAGLPPGLGFERIPSFRALVRDNKDRQAFTKLGGA